MPRVSRAERAEALDRLQRWLSPGDTVYCILRHVSRSGMQRTIQTVKLEDGQPLYLGYNVARVIGASYDDKREGVKVDGCGMDMGFHIVYSLSRVLFPLGFGCIGQTCPSNDHSNGDRDYTPDNQALLLELTQNSVSLQPQHMTPVEHWHNDGGYALTARWL